MNISAHRALIYALVGLVLFGGLVIILQVWGLLLHPGLFLKLLATIGVLIFIAGFLLVVKLDFSEHKKLKDENYID